MKNIKHRENLHFQLRKRFSGDDDVTTGARVVGRSRNAMANLIIKLMFNVVWKALHHRLAMKSPNSAFLGCAKIVRDRRDRWILINDHRLAKGKLDQDF